MLPNSAKRTNRFLIRAEEPDCSDELIEIIERDGVAQLLDEMGPEDGPRTFVVAMAEEYANTLRQRFADRIILEPDRSLTHSGHSPRESGEKENTAQPEADDRAERQAKTITATIQTLDDKSREDQIEMAEKNEQTATAHSGRSGSGGAATQTSGGISTPPGRVLAAKPAQFIIAPRRISGMMQPMALDYVEQALRSSPDVDVVDRIGPRGLVGTLADGLGGAPHVLVAKMAGEKAEILAQQSAGQLIVERDQPLHLDLSETSEPGFVTAAVASGGPMVSVAFMVLGKGNAPIKDAEVRLFGYLLRASGITDERGVVTLPVPGDAVQSVTGVYVKPKSDYWTFYQAQPALDTGQTNLLNLRPLSETFQGFPRQQAIGWGQRMMRLDQLPNGVRGQGIRIAIVDSGVGTSHSDLQGIKFGFDVATKKSEPQAWNQDPISHGSHCAGVIAGADNSTGIRGFAPDAEIHVCKEFPGQISQLIEALEYCIEKQIDVVNLTLSGTEPSEVLEQQILRAKRLGVACIAAAGNSGGAVQYPASSPNVLAVAAIGKAGEFPPDSYHAQTVGVMDRNGLFSPKFTCFGPEIAVCAPGVAILSSVPPNNYAVWDGTSMAASHVTGLAALVLAHHPDFQGPFRMRTADRVERLFQILRASAQPVNLGDSRRTGFGVPDVLVALGLAPQMHSPIHSHLHSQLHSQLHSMTRPMSGYFGARGSFGELPFNAAALLYGHYPEFGIFGLSIGFAPGSMPYQHQVPVGTW